MGGVVVHDDVQLPARVCLRDLPQEPQELLVAVPGVTGVGDLAGSDLQAREQRGGAVPDIVVGLLLGDPGPKAGQTRLLAQMTVSRPFSFRVR
jgi:hypothetical protein